nr:MAG TPA: hypothetical protein [Caudoviricetes sp.]
MGYAILIGKRSSKNISLLTGIRCSHGPHLLPFYIMGSGYAAQI